MCGVPMSVFWPGVTRLWWHRFMLELKCVKNIESVCMLIHQPSLAEKLKDLMQNLPIYRIKGSPVNDHPFSLFDVNEDASILRNEYGIPTRCLGHVMSPWAAKRLKEFGGDISQFKVEKVRPSILHQIAIAKTEPGDENNQDISSLVGKVDIRQLEHFSQDDPEANLFLKNNRPCPRANQLRARLSPLRLLTRRYK